MSKTYLIPAAFGLLFAAWLSFAEGTPWIIICAAFGLWEGFGLGHQYHQEKGTAEAAAEQERETYRTGIVVKEDPVWQWASSAFTGIVLTIGATLSFFVSGHSAGAVLTSLVAVTLVFIVITALMVRKRARFESGETINS